LKKKQKLLGIGARGAAALTCNNQKFFGSFFQKRNACFLPFRAPQAEGPESVSTAPGVTQLHKRGLIPEAFMVDPYPSLARTKKQAVLF
jgi:hypothetical protein